MAIPKPEEKKVIELNPSQFWNSMWDSIGVATSGLLRGSVFLQNKYIKPAELEDLVQRMRNTEELPLDRKPVIIDARRPDEWRHSHIWSARNVHAWKFKSSAFDGIPKEQLIVTYCAVGLRSGYLARELRKRGFKNAHVLFGGYYHWVNSGREIYDAAEQITKEVLPQHLLAATLLPGEVIAKTEELSDLDKDEDSGKKKKKKFLKMILPS